jgi:hypothetical protein
VEYDVMGRIQAIDGPRRAWNSKPALEEVGSTERYWQNAVVAE